MRTVEDIVCTEGMFTTPGDIMSTKGGYCD